MQTVLLLLSPLTCEIAQILRFRARAAQTISASLVYVRAGKQTVGQSEFAMHTRKTFKAYG
jgi:hypothetical protein